MGNQATSQSCTGIGSSASVDCYLSCIHGTKLDTNISEPEQGAAAPADLLQQEPHVEVVDSKSSVAPSDEERSAAGISTTGLQTKRLSGAQQKRLTRERKMKEGTRRDKKPPRKTLLSQEKGALGSSGGAERPHSDSSTPSSEKQQPKIPGPSLHLTGSYKEADAGIKMAVFTDAIQMSNWIRLKLT
jgi:hypothetical protein